MATKNHKGQTAADVRAERIQEARDLALSILEVVEIGARQTAPVGGYNWGHAGDWGAVVERLQDAHGAALMHAAGDGRVEAVSTRDLAQTFLRVRSLLAGSVPTAVRTYPVVRRGRVIRVSVPESSR